MEDIDVKDQFARIQARFAELQQLIVSEGERTRRHIETTEKVQKIVLTEVRGLSTKVDRLARPRRGLVSSP